MPNVEVLERRRRIRVANERRFHVFIRRAAWDLAREHFAWTYPVGTAIAVTALIWLVQGRDKALEDVVSSLIVGGATVLVAGVTYGLSLRKAASVNYAEQLEAVEIIEKERDDANKEIERLNALLLEKRKDDELAALLSAFHRRGVTHILNKPPTDASGIEGWRNLEKQWRLEVLNVMHLRGCSIPEVNHVDVIGTFNVHPMHPIFEIAKDLSMFAERLRRLLDIVQKYSKD